MSTENRFGEGTTSKSLMPAYAGGGGGGRSSDEQFFYDRKPEQTVSIGGVTERGLETARLNSDGTITLGKETWESGPAKTMSTTEYMQHRANFKALDTSYREAYQRWWDEGMARGYVAGSPRERI